MNEAKSNIDYFRAGADHQINFDTNTQTVGRDGERKKIFTFPFSCYTTIIYDSFKNIQS